MCGIAGILSFSSHSGVTREMLRPMADALIHRGPDDAGYYVDARGRCGLAFRRLSIIDLAGGRQPLANEDETVWVVFNGEIYNYRELRAELEALGHAFRTSSDTETIVHGFEQWGDGVFARLHGMFAIALWDQRNSRLTLARDRFGKKPLCYCAANGRLTFASELKSLLALAQAPREIDPAALHQYLVLQYVPPPGSIFRGIAKLPPGHFLHFEADGRTGAPQEYWRLPVPDGRRDSIDTREAMQRLDVLLTRAVEKRLIAHVPLGAFLSGGIDSSIVVGLMRKLGVSPLRTFSIGFNESAYDETAYARLVARHFNTQHAEQVVTPRAAEVLDTLAHHYDEPFADSSAIPTYYVSKFTRAHVTVALTGDGGDEAFGGYDRYRALGTTSWADRVPVGVRRGVASVAGWLPHGTPKSLTHRAFRLLSALPFPPAQRYLAWVNVFPPMMLAEAYQPAFLAKLDVHQPSRWFEELMNSQGSLMARANRADAESYLPYDLLTKVDIASMACSLECRAPFLDHELFEFAAGLPDRLRFAGGGKRILKNWARSLLPPEILKRRKMGFGVPVGLWFRGELRTELRDAVLAGDSLCSRIFRAGWLRNMLDAHVAGRENHEHRLWALLMLERWRRVWSPVLH